MRATAFISKSRPDCEVDFYGVAHYTAGYRCAQFAWRRLQPVGFGRGSSTFAATNPHKLKPVPRQTELDTAIELP
jgi:hypothetical protein